MSATKKVANLLFTLDELVGFLQSTVVKGERQLLLLITLHIYTGVRIRIGNAENCKLRPRAEGHALKGEGN